MSEPYVPAVVPPDPERDKRVAARRAADASRASRALDKLMADPDQRVLLLGGYNAGWTDGYAACELHHNRHYGVPTCAGCGVALLADRGPHDCETAGRIS